MLLYHVLYPLIGQLDFHSKATGRVYLFKTFVSFSPTWKEILCSYVLETERLFGMVSALAFYSEKPEVVSNGRLSVTALRKVGSCFQRGEAESGKLARDSFLRLRRDEVPSLPLELKKFTPPPTMYMFPKPTTSNPIPYLLSHLNPSIASARPPCASSHRLPPPLPTACLPLRSAPLPTGSLCIPPRTSSSTSLLPPRRYPDLRLPRRLLPRCPPLAPPQTPSSRAAASHPVFPPPSSPPIAANCR